MYKKNIIEPTLKMEDGLETVTHEYYGNRKREKFGYIGPTIKGIDVGVARYADLHLDYETKDLTTVEVSHKDYDFGGYRVREFTPANLKEGSATVFYVHGGGFITGTLERYVHVDSRLAELIEGKVFHVDYTLSPETGFPTALNQCYHAISYVHEHHEQFGIDPSKIAIMGDSAGGNLCAALPLLDKENRYISYDILYYPCVDMSDESAKKFDLSYFGKDLTPLVEARVKSLMDLSSVNDAYLQNGEDPKDELISPIFAKDLTGYPETLVITAEYDFLTLQSIDFADLLDRNGIKVDFYKYLGTFHGFLDRVGYMESSDWSMQNVAEHLKTRFGY